MMWAHGVSLRIYPPADDAFLVIDVRQQPLISLIVGLVLLLLGLVAFFWYTPPPAQVPVPRPPVTAAEAPGGLRLVCWNVESDGNDPQVIARQLVELGKYDLYALQEVHSHNHEVYGLALQEEFGKQLRYVTSSTGHNDRLMVAFDASRLTLLAKHELFEFGGITLNDWRHRSPLVAHFRDQRSGGEFLFLTVHLARGSAEFRSEQARGLREWAGGQTLPIVAMGDFNMDYHFESERGNEAFDVFLTGDVWHWVRPGNWVDTNYYDGDGDGQDDFPGSMLDFAFLAGAAKSWPATFRVIERPGDFPDDATTADHRPVELTFQ